MACLYAVKSALLEHVAYSAPAHALLLCFKSGERYVYEDVEQSRWDEFFAADSQGSYYSRNIKGVYRSIKMQGPLSSDDAFELFVEQYTAPRTLRARPVKIDWKSVKTDDLYA